MTRYWYPSETDKKILNYLATETTRKFATREIYEHVGGFYPNLLKRLRILEINGWVVSYASTPKFWQLKSSSKVKLGTMNYIERKCSCGRIMKARENQLTVSCRHCKKRIWITRIIKRD